MELQPAERALVGADGWCWHFGWTLIYWFDRDQKDLVACCFWRRSIIEDSGLFNTPAERNVASLLDLLN